MRSADEAQQVVRPFRLLVTGSRTWGSEAADTVRLRQALNHVAQEVGYRTPILIHGGARGLDRLAASHWRGLGLPTEEHLPDWDGPWGRQAGFRRNELMVNLGANLCLAFIRDQSRGATHCANFAERRNIRTIRFYAGRMPAGATQGQEWQVK